MDITLYANVASCIAAIASAIYAGKQAKIAHRSRTFQMRPELLELHRYLLSAHSTVDKFYTTSPFSALASGPKRPRQLSDDQIEELIRGRASTDLWSDSSVSQYLSNALTSCRELDVILDYCAHGPEPKDQNDFISRDNEVEQARKEVRVNLSRALDIVRNKLRDAA